MRTGSYGRPAGGWAPDGILRRVEAPADAERPLRYVALGDSYTIGTSVAAAERWPNLLVGRVGTGTLELAANLAVNGYTSADVLERELPEALALRPELATLLAGVNDVVRGVPAEAYRRSMTAILDGLLAALPPKRVVLVSTPDYTVTPEGAKYGDRRERAAEIRRFNGIAAELARERAVAFVDILDISVRAAAEPDLVAADGLHPSGRQYALWVDRVEPAVTGLLRPAGD
jgi:acyl-CoA thioesterase-1